jgi:hypothetical protein
VTSFKHFFNKHGIEIISWGEVKDIVLTIMNYIYDQQINKVTLEKWQKSSTTLHPLLPFKAKQ